MPGREVNNDDVVSRVYEDLLRYGEVKPDLLQQPYGAYDPSPVVSSRTCLASSTNEAGTSTSLGPADRKSGASKPAARWISDGMPASFSTPSISSATDSSGDAATFTHLSSMHVSYPRLFPEARGRRPNSVSSLVHRAPITPRTSALLTSVVIAGIYLMIGGIWAPSFAAQVATVPLSDSLTTAGGTGSI
jgi:hypothetical protein